MVLRARAAAVKTIHSRSSTPDYPINSSAAPGRSKRNGRKLEQLLYKEDDGVDIDKGSVPTDTPPPRPRPSGLQSPMRVRMHHHRYLPRAYVYSPTRWGCAPLAEIIRRYIACFSRRIRWRGR